MNEMPRGRRAHRAERREAGRRRRAGRAADRAGRRERDRGADRTAGSGACRSAPRTWGSREEPSPSALCSPLRCSRRSSALAADARAVDEAGARAFFLKAAPVFLSPRCLNCHPSGERPLQTDRSRPHAMSVKRGLEGRGVTAMQCANCHQPQNTAGLNGPPGAPNWHLPPQSMKMVFEGRSAGRAVPAVQGPGAERRQDRGPDRRARDAATRS